MADEEEFFHKQDQEAKARLKAKLDAQQAEADRAERKKLHHHKCGKCGADMQTHAFRGIEIEECPACGAVLLDPGELQQLAGEDNTGVLSSFFSMFGGSTASPQEDER